MLKKIINLGAIYYTAVSAVMLIFSIMFGIESTILAPQRFFTILLYSFVASVGTALLHCNFKSAIVARLLHVLCYIGGFLFCILIPYGAKFTTAVISLAVYSVAYVVICVLKSAIAKKSQNSQYQTPNKCKREKSDKTTSKKQLETEYKSLFSDSGKENR